MISAAEARQSHNRSLRHARARHRRAGDAAPRGRAGAAGRHLPALLGRPLNDCVEDADIELIVTALSANPPLAATHLVQCEGQRRLRQRLRSSSRASPFRAGPASAWSRFVDRLRSPSGTLMPKLVLSNGDMVIDQRWIDGGRITIGRDKRPSHLPSTIPRWPHRTARSPRWGTTTSRGSARMTLWRQRRARSGASCSTTTSSTSAPSTCATWIPGKSSEIDLERTMLILGLKLFPTAAPTTPG